MQGQVIRAACAVAITLAACDRRAVEPAATSQPDPPSACPPCECVCDCKDPTATATATAPSPDVSDLVASASRKMNHGDGEGCLADLDQVAAADPKMDERLAVTRGQCEMLVGKCAEGKARVQKWYEVETAMTPDRARVTAEQLGSMRCRGGNSTDRDRLLVALFNLSDGAYMNTRDPAFCRENVQIARDLIPKVPPAGPDDTQISGGAQALFHTAAACYAKAGDCAAALAILRGAVPGRRPRRDPRPGPAQARGRESFESSIPRCAAKAP